MYVYSIQLIFGHSKRDPHDAVASLCECYCLMRPDGLERAKVSEGAKLAVSTGRYSAKGWVRRIRRAMLRTTNHDCDE